jgi:GNAT superfamily N-acetyltransferase
MITVRTAAENDLSELSRLWYEKMALQQQSDKRFAFALQPQTKWVETASHWLSDKRCTVLVAENNNDLLGYVIGWIQDTPPGLLPEKIGAVTELMVDPHSQHSGAGRLLLQAIREWFSAQGIQHSIAYVSSRLAVEQAFWQAQGTTEWINIVWLK